MVKKKNAMIIGFQIAMLILSFIVFTFSNSFSSDHEMFVSLSRYGVVIVFVLIYLLYKLQNALFTIPNVFFIMFVLFQFGMPITYVLNPHHYNYYFNLFNSETHVKALIYTLCSIQLFCLGMSIVIGKKGKNDYTRRDGKISRRILSNPQKVAEAALLLFIITAIFAVPMNMKAALGAVGSRLAGVSIGITYRGTMSENGFLRFIQEFYFSSALLFLCFSNKVTAKKVVSVFYIAVSVMLVLVADRNAGITSLVVFAFYKYYTDKNRKGIIKNAVIIVSIILVGIISVYIAQNRLTNAGLSSVLKGNFFVDALDEVGFNFTSICFVMSYIPKYDGFKYGLSYLASFILLIPKSFDFLGLYPSLQSVLGETWLWNMNNSVGRSNLSFGVGFSMIAESFYNFAWYGLLMMIPIAFLSSSLLRERGKDDNPWRIYIRLALMLGFFTLPRRQFASMLKSIEYSVVFMAIYIIVYLSFVAKRRIRVGKKEEVIVKK